MAEVKKGIKQLDELNSTINTEIKRRVRASVHLTLTRSVAEVLGEDRELRKINRGWSRSDVINYIFSGFRNLANVIARNLHGYDISHPRFPSGRDPLPEDSPLDRHLNVPIANHAQVPAANHDQIQLLAAGNRRQAQNLAVAQDPHNRRAGAPQGLAGNRRNRSPSPQDAPLVAVNDDGNNGHPHPNGGARPRACVLLLMLLCISKLILKNIRLSYKFKIYIGKVSTRI